MHLENKYYSQGSKTPSSKQCKPFASSSAQRSRPEVTRLDTDVSEKDYWSCNKILEETDEDSVANLTPRLREDKELEVNRLEEAQSKCLRKSAEDTFSKEIYATKTTLETDMSSTNKYELDSESTSFDRGDIEHPLSLSIISSSAISTEDKFVSPCSTGYHRIPTLNLSKVKQTLGLTSLNSSYLSNTNYSSNDSKVSLSDRLAIANSRDLL